MALVAVSCVPMTAHTLLAYHQLGVGGGHYIWLGTV